MASSKSSIINLIKEYILRLKENNISVEKVLLFGSIMRGTSREDSDIDIAVISSSFKGDRYSDIRSPFAPSYTGWRSSRLSFFSHPFKTNGHPGKVLNKQDEE